MSTPDPNMRISNTEREAIIARLHAATEEGRLDLNEFAERSSQTYEAKTYAEIEGLLADLPATGGELVAPTPAPESRPAPAELRLNPTASSVERKGEWTVPDRTVVNAKASSVKLDYRHATINLRDIAVKIDLKASSLELVLPRNAYAVDEDTDLMASSAKNHCSFKGDTNIRFTVSGFAKASSVNIRYERRFLWWRW
ncbi:DUF1707 SHOCT-like domain-containing protein [Glycomyces buryatensis]|nr:DUF1707 domain-containing protein [Glycomyces buryatensis]